MEIKELKDKLSSKDDQLTKIGDEITAAMVDDTANAETIRDLKEQRTTVTKERDELKNQIADAEKKQVNNHILENTKEKEVQPMHEIENKQTATKKAINDYLHSQGKVKDASALQVTSVEADPILPKEIIYNPESEINSVSDLKNYVTTTPVTTASGSYPILQRATDVLPTVEELKENPKLAEPNFKDVEWKVQTYRGAIPLSQEAIADAAVDLTGLVGKNVQEKVVNTTNSAISDKLKTFTAVSSTQATMVDDIKKALNVTLDPAYAPTVIASQSFYNLLDTLKDANGQYIFHQDITGKSDGVLQGINVIRVNDTLLGAAGEAHAFIGDLSKAILFADRQEVSLSWADDKIWGVYLMAALRFDIEVADEDAGVFMTVAEGATTSGN